MRWYADDSDLKTIRDLNFPNVVLFGGFAIPYTQEAALRTAIEDVKARFGHRRSPVKWNFKDLKKKYEDQHQLQTYETLLGNMHELRREIFCAAAEFDICIIFSLVQGYSSDKKVLKEAKADLCRYVFTNGLMRFALHAQEREAAKPEVVLDWPDSGNSRPYDVEYAKAFNRGETTDGIQYRSGPLNALNFADSPLYARMTHNTLLQFADLVLGATREFVHHCIDQERKGHGVDLLARIASKFRGHPNNVVGRGISVNGRADDIKNKISEKYRELYTD